MKQEYDSFRAVAGFDPCGIRMHYVRYDDKTLEHLSNIGYSFDTTEFDKTNGGSIKPEYQVGKMWEFPLTIMDSYLPQGTDAAKKTTLQILEECRKAGLQYITVLFHDFHYCEDYIELKEWYRWLIKYFADSEEYSFISYEEAIMEKSKGKE